MAKKNDGTSLPAGAQEHAIKILDRVWTLSRKRAAAKSKRENLFVERDSIDGQIDELGDAHSSEGRELSSRWRDVVKQIERLKVDIDFYSDEIDRAIEEGEQGKFDFVEEPITPPESLYSKLKPKKAEAPKPEEPKDTRPVGVPKGRGGKGESAADSIPAGVDQHLAAAVIELGLSDRDTDRLVGAELMTIADVAKLFEVAGGTLGPVMDRLNCGQEIASRIKKAVDQYRSKHRKAMATAEREEGGL